VSQSDRIEIRGLRVLGTHGVLAEERVRPQQFEIDLDLELDMIDASRSDELSDTVDYSEVIDRVGGVVRGPGSYRLLEGLAAAIAESVLEDGSLSSVTVCLRKLQPPLPADIATVGVRLVRSR
jgi:dihydroneopterin aldolase